MKPLRRLSVLLLLCACALPVEAALIFVNTADDELNSDGDCSLREAVEAANTNSAVDNCTAGQSVVTDAIFFTVNEEFVLDSIIEITERVNIEGSGRDTTVIRQEAAHQLFRVEMADTSHDIQFNNMTLRDGVAVVGVHGGAVQLADGDEFTFSNVAFINNTTEVAVSEIWAGGGAIFAGPLLKSFDPTLVVEDCLFEGNSSVPEFNTQDQGRGGAILSVRYLNSDTSLANRPLDAITVNDSEFNNNSSNGSGSALYTHYVPLVNISGSQFIGNSMAAGDVSRSGTVFAAGVSNHFLFVSDSTFVGNIAPSTTLASAVYVSLGINGIINNSTFTEHIRRPVGFGALSNGTLHYSTLVNNGEGENFEPALFVSGNTTVSVRASIIWNNWPTTDICNIDPGASYTSLGYNIDSDGSCTGHADDLPTTDPGLLQLDAWGDDIAHFDLLTFLPHGAALDAAYLNDCPAPLGGNVISDARGEPKPVDGSETGMNLCDIGAVEYQFEEDPVVNNLNLTIDGSGGGRVFSANYENFDCTESCTGHFAEFAQVRLTADPDSGSEFTGWGGACSGTGLCIVNMSLNRSVTATFALIPTGFDLDVVLDGNGTGTVSSNPAGIACPGQCEATFDEDTMVTLAATPDGGQVFQGWSGACSGTGDCEVTMNHALTVRATFLNSDTLFMGGFE